MLLLRKDVLAKREETAKEAVRLYEVLPVEMQAPVLLTLVLVRLTVMELSELLLPVNTPQPAHAHTVVFGAHVAMRMEMLRAGKAKACIEALKARAVLGSTP